MVWWPLLQTVKTRVCARSAPAHPMGMSTVGVSVLWWASHFWKGLFIYIFKLLQALAAICRDLLTLPALFWGILGVGVRRYAYSRSTCALRNCTHPGMLQEYYIWHSIWHVFGMLSSSTSATCMPGALGTAWTRAAFCHEEGASNLLRVALMAFGTLMGARGYCQVHVPAATAARRAPLAS